MPIFFEILNDNWINVHYIIGFRLNKTDPNRTTAFVRGAGDFYTEYNIPESVRSFKDRLDKVLYHKK